MAKRVTIMLDSDLDKKLRHLQAKEIVECADTNKCNASVSFSKIINDILREGLKKHKFR